MFEGSKLVVVEDDAALAEIALRFSGASVIGVDTEADSMYHYQERVCLVQFTDAIGDVIVDPLRVSDMSPLAPVFADPRIVKVFHGADYDVVSLKRDFHFEIRNLFDTLLAAQFLGLERLGLADLVATWFGISLDKKHQRHDWSQRPLEEEHLDYARGDTHWLPALRDILLRRLVRVGRVEHLIEECALLEEREWQRRAFDPEGWTRIKGASALDDVGKRVLRRLYHYRDDQARRMDRPPYKVMGDGVLTDIAARRPRTPRALEQLLPTMHGLRRRHEDGLLRAITQGLADPEPPEVHEEDEDTRERRAPGRLTGRSAERVYEELKGWRNATIEASGKRGYVGPRLNAFSVASNGTLKEIARARPLSLEELAAVDDVRRWQVRDFGPAILALLDRVAPMTAEEAAPKRRRKR